MAKSEQRYVGVPILETVFNGQLPIPISSLPESFDSLSFHT